MIVVGPRKPINELIATRQAEEAARRSEAAVRQEADRRQAESKVRATAPQCDAKADNKLIERMDALEAQMRRIEAILDSILKRIDKK
jgi:hypothetical protein